VTLLKHIFKQEHAYFRKLSQDGQRLISSVIFCNTISPIFILFLAAFLWRQTHDIVILALYNLAFYITIPIGFYLNGYLLRRYYPNHLHMVGSVARGLVIAALMFLPTINYPLSFLFGLLHGAASSLFWGNRNWMVLKVTTSSNRLYFSGLDQISNTLSGIIVPVLLGVFIVYGTTYEIYTPIQAYYVVAFITVLISFWSAYMTRDFHLKLPQVTQIALRQPSHEWIQTRAVAVIFGLLNGILGFVPALLILLFIGHEDALGTIQSLAAIATAVMMYFVARKINVSKRFWIMTVSTIFSLIAALGLYATYSATGVLIYTVFQSLAAPLMIAAITSFCFDHMEKESKLRENEYSYIVDWEIFLNIGRVIGVFLFMYYLAIFPDEEAIRISLLMFGVAQLTLLGIVHANQKQQSSRLTLHLHEQIKG